MTVPSATPSRQFTVYQDTGQWLGFTWFWIRHGETGQGHGPYPARWIARLAGWWSNR